MSGKPRSPILIALGGAAILAGALVIVMAVGPFELHYAEDHPANAQTNATRPSNEGDGGAENEGDGGAEEDDGAEESPAKVKNVILVIGDGFGVGGITATSLLIHGPEGGFAVESAKVIGLMRTTAANSYVTDSAAAATAMATGTKTNRAVVGQAPDGSKLVSIFTRAREQGLATGAVTTSGIMDATPAGFTAHAESRKLYAPIMEQVLRSGCEVLIGAHWGTLEDPAVSKALDELRQNGTTIARTAEELRAADGPVVGLFDPRPGTRWSGGPPLVESVDVALRVLSQDEDGFLLLVESEETDGTAHDNDVEGLERAARELDAATRRVLEFAEETPGTLVVVTADHDTGGPGVMRSDLDEPIRVGWVCEQHTATWVPLFAFGPGASRFAGVIDNTDLPVLMAEALGLPPRD